MNEYLFSKHIDAGYSVMPVHVAGTRPIPVSEGWSKWCGEFPTTEEISGWDFQYPVNGRYGIAILCGEKSYVTVLDIDTDDPAIHALCPKSPVWKVGTPGREAHFFRWDPSHKTVMEKEGRPVGIHADGRFHVLPPSRHPKTGRLYNYGPKHLIDCDVFDLPELDVRFIDKIPIVGGQILNKAEGRNNKLVAMVSAARIDGKSSNDIEQMIYEYDLLHHKPRLFMDQSEGFPAKNELDARVNALRFVSRVTESILKSGLKVSVRILNSEIDDQSEPVKLKPSTLPLFSDAPFRRAFDSVANSVLSHRMDLATEAVCSSIMATIASGRVCVMSPSPKILTYPNQSTIVLAPIGSGKSQLETLVSEILQPVGLLAEQDFKSAEAFIDDLPEQPFRLHMFDEGANFLEIMKPRKDMINTAMNTINSVFTSQGKLYRGSKALSGTKRRGVCWNPCVNFLVFSHVQGFENSVGGYFATSGFFPRSLIIYCESTEENVFIDEAESSKQFLLAFRDDLLRKYRVRVKPEFAQLLGTNIHKELNALGLLQSPYAPNILEYDASGVGSFKDVKEEIKRLMSEADEFHKGFLNRALERSSSLALIEALMWGRDFVSSSDIKYGFNKFLTQYEATEYLRTSVRVADPLTAMVDRIELLLTSNGPLSKSEILRKTRATAGLLNQTLEIMRKDDMVEVMSMKRSARQNVEVYRISSTKSIKDASSFSAVT